MTITTGIPPKRSVELLSRDLAILQRSLMVLSMLRSTMLISSTNMIVLFDNNFRTKKKKNVDMVGGGPCGSGEDDLIFSMKEIHRSNNSSDDLALADTGIPSDVQEILVSLGSIVRSSVPREGSRKDSLHDKPLFGVEGNAIDNKLY